MGLSVMNLDLLARCHSQLAPLLGERAEPLGVTRHVERHRQFWRPETPRLILLAESHVHTSEAETNCKIRVHDLPANIPLEFVRLVYCLGYGENGLLDGTATGRNTGTPQFWQIFASCLRTISSRRDFRDIQASQTPSLKHRIAGKVRLLEALRSGDLARRCEHRSSLPSGSAEAPASTEASRNSRELGQLRGTGSGRCFSRGNPLHRCRSSSNSGVAVG